MKLNEVNKITEGTIKAEKNKGDLELSRDRWQGVAVSRWKELSKSRGRNLYKLAFKSEWDEQEKAIESKDSVKGALGLVKISWGQNGWRRTGAGQDEEIKVENIDKVWLIIAKSESSIYLIPVVRSSAKWGDSANEKKMKENQDTKEVWTKGVQSISTWDYDKGDGWKAGRNEQLKKSLSSGFLIMRGEDTVFVGRNWENWIKKGDETLKDWWKKKIRNNIRSTNNHQGEYLYQNAGILEGRGKSESCGECKQAEKYFPLDIAVLGDQTKLRNLSDWYGNLIQEIEVKDTIAQVKWL